MPRKEENDKRSAVKNLFWARLQILRRSAPQNDNAVFALNHFLSGTHSSARPGRLRGARFQREPAPGARSKTLKCPLLVHCSQTPRQTGIVNWRQRGKVERKRCSGRPWLIEINTGFSRASRSPAGFGTTTTPIPLSKPIIACELQNRRTTKNRWQTTANEQRFSLNPAAPLRRQRTAESTNHADRSRNPCHSGCEVAGSEDKTKIIYTEKSAGTAGGGTGSKGDPARNQSKRLRNGCPENDIKQNS